MMKQNFVAALLPHHLGHKTTNETAQALISRGNWLMQEVEGFFKPMAGKLSVSDMQAEELERFIEEIEKVDSGVIAGARILG
jgi:hypothetical protein